MAKFNIVIANVEKAHVAHVHSYRLFPDIQRRLEPRPIGTIHSTLEENCSLPHCRNCGDPDYIEDCKSKGHCPRHGIDHGLAPASVLTKNGYILVEIK